MLSPANHSLSCISRLTLGLFRYSIDRNCLYRLVVVDYSEKHELPKTITICNYSSLLIATSSHLINVLRSLSYLYIVQATLLRLLFLKNRHAPVRLTLSTLLYMS